jgi:hypothetical protein
MLENAFYTVSTMLCRMSTRLIHSATRLRGS